MQKYVVDMDDADEADHENIGFGNTQELKELFAKGTDEDDRN